MVASIDKFIGAGLYTPAEAAFYAREHTRTVIRWLRGTSRGDAPVVSTQFDDDRFVTFLDFVQTLAIANIRRQYDVPLQTIRAAVDEAKEKWGIQYPFAVEHRVYLLDRGKPDPLNPSGRHRRFDLFIDRPAGLTQLTGRHKGNLASKEVLQLYLKNLRFGPDGLANSFCAWTRGSREIWMNPQRRFGEPLTPSGYTANALWDAVQIEGSIDAAATAYGVDREEIELACDYFDHLRFPRKSD